MAIKLGMEIINLLFVAFMISFMVLIMLFYRIWKIRAPYDRYYVRNELLIGSAWFILIVVLHSVAYWVFGEEIYHLITFATLGDALCFGIVLSNTTWVFYEKKASVKRARAYTKITAQLELIKSRTQSHSDPASIESPSITEHAELLTLDEISSINIYGISNSMFDFVGLYSVLSTQAGIHLFFTFLLNSQKHTINNLIVQLCTYSLSLFILSIHILCIIYIVCH